MLESQAPRETQLVPPATPSLVEGRVVASPFQFYVTGEDGLRITCTSSVAGDVVVRVRFLPINSRIIQVNEFHCDPPADRTPYSDDYTLGEGYVLNLEAFAESGAPRIGQTFVRVQLVRGADEAAKTWGTFCQGYVTEEQSLAWPGSPIASSVEGGGYIRNIIGTNPAAGSEVSEVVPTGARWKLRAFGVGFTTSATVANRRPRLALGLAGGPNVICPALFYISASSAVIYYWAANLPFTANLGPLSHSAPVSIDVVLLAGEAITTSTENFQAGDDYGVTVYQVEEWLEVNG